MKLIRPQYFRDFQCLAGQCGDTCCAGWEICIDPESYKKYQGISGPLGERLRANILCSEEGYEFALRPGKRCPFLNDQNLCELILELGQDSLCEICREHPRFYEEFGDYTLTGLGLCCEEAARLILTQDARLEILDRPGAPMALEPGQRELIHFMKGAWTEAMDFMNRADSPLRERIAGLLNWGEALQEALETGGSMPPLRPHKPHPQAMPDIFRALVTVFQGLEALEADWPDYIAQVLRGTERPVPLPREFESCARRLVVYFLYRHFMGALYDGDALSKIKFSVLSAGMVCAMAVHRLRQRDSLELRDWIALSKRYSKEIEYSDENVEALWDACRNEAALETQNLSGMF